MKQVRLVSRVQTQVTREGSSGQDEICNLQKASSERVRIYTRAVAVHVRILVAGILVWQCTGILVAGILVAVYRTPVAGILVQES